MSNLTYAWIIGIVVGVILVIILFKLLNKDGSIHTRYDERQQIVRGRAYRAGFFTCLIANAFMVLLATGSRGIGVLGMSAFFIPILAGVIAQVSYCIFKDGYVGLNTNMTRFIIIMAVIGAFNLFLGIASIVRGFMMQNGQLQGSFMNLLCGVMFIVIGAELLIKKCIDAREE